MNKFETSTNPKFARKVYGLTMLFTYIALAVIGLFLLNVGIGAFIFVEALVLASMLFSTLICFKNNSHFTFTFEGGTLTINGVNPMQTWQIYDVTASDFILTQTESEKALDCCSMKIKNTSFRFYGIENYTALKGYIEENFK